MPSADRVADILTLAREHDDHLMALVRANDRIFLNPDAVGSVTKPVLAQLEHFLQNDGPHRIAGGSESAADEFLVDVEHALRTGEIRGLANGDDDDDDDDVANGVQLDLAWRENDVDAWAAALRCDAHQAKECVCTPEGDVIGPLPFMEWLGEHLPPAVSALTASLGRDALSKASETTQVEALEQAMDLAGMLATGIDHELQAVEPRTPFLRQHLPRLVLVLHYAGQMNIGDQSALEGVSIRDLRDRVMGRALAAAEWLAAEHARLSLGEARSALLCELQCLAFIAAQLAEQDVRAAGADALAEAQLVDDLGISRVGLEDEPHALVGAQEMAHTGCGSDADISHKPRALLLLAIGLVGEV